MQDIKNRLEDNALLGYMKFSELGSFYLMPIAYWILNYSKYDPTYNPKEWAFVFRNNILNVRAENTSDFFSSIEQDKIPFVELEEAIRNKLEGIALSFYIDFDSKLFVSAFENIEVETYLPDDTWKGKFDNPLLYLPADVKMNLENR